jgi:hypothetical protein
MAKWTPAGGGQIIGNKTNPSSGVAPAPVQNNAVGSSPAAVAAMIQNYPPLPPPPPPPPPPSGGGYSPSYSASSVTTSSYTPPPPPPLPKPPTWVTTSTFQEPKGVRQADPDIVIFNEDAISPELLIELGYEDISGIELINISRSDIIDGQNVSYSAVKQLSALRRRYNPNNIIALPELSSSFFSRFQIDIVLRGIQEPYFNESGDLVIEINDIKDDEVIDVEIDTNGTINEVDFS